MSCDQNYYEATTSPLDLPILEGHKEVDVCVIGGGFAGLNTALGLVERGVKSLAVLEAYHPGFGASGRNGGFVFAGFSKSASSLLKEQGPVSALSMYQGTLNAVETIRNRIKSYHMDCDLVEEGVLWANWFQDKNVLLNRQQLLQDHFNHFLPLLSKSEITPHIHSSRYSGALLEPEGFHFHPLKYAQGLVKVLRGHNVSVFAQSPAVSLTRTGEAWHVSTPQGVIKAQTVVLSCGGYLSGLYPAIDQSILPIATYVVTTAPLKERVNEVLPTKRAVYDTRFAFDYYRPLPDTRLLWGGRISVRDRAPKEITRLLRKDMLKVFPQLEDVEIEYAWSGLMSYARHEMPQLGQIEKNLWMAQAFGGHGVATTTQAGELLAQAIAQPSYDQISLFAPYGLKSVHKPAGYVAAQLSYWWAQGKDY